MCLAIPAQIVEIGDVDPHIAKVDVGGVRRNVNISLLTGEHETIRSGDWILVHVGFALSKIGEEQALDQLRMLRALGEDIIALEEVQGYRI